MQFHEAANIFQLDEEHIDQLVADIKARGLEVPIEVLDGKIIDGRRRWIACEKAKVEPDFCEVQTDDPLNYVLSINLHRRHLDQSQKAMVAGRCIDYYRDRAKERMSEGGKKSAPGRPSEKGRANWPTLSGGRARDEAGAVLGVGPRNIDRADNAGEKLRAKGVR